MAQGRILLVDDEEDIGIIVKRGLSLAGFDVSVETDPIAAFKKFRPGMYDLVILDLKMPDISGIDLFKKLYEIDPKIKACFFSAFDLNLRGELIKVHPEIMNKVCFIEKPVSIGKFVQIVRSEIMSAK